MATTVADRRGPTGGWNDERGEIASWLLIAAALVVAATAAAAVLSAVTDRLADEVAVAAGVSAGQVSAERVAPATTQPAPSAHNVVPETPTLADTRPDSGWSFSGWHFEGREAHNRNLPPTVDAIEPGSGWIELSAAQSIYHDDPATALPERKFIHPDGREAVYHPETGELVTDPRYAGTFNYVNPAPAPDDPTDVGGWLSWTVRGIGHGITDVVPYYLGGNVRGPDDVAPAPTPP